ncbi:uncharacterized protein EI90DRAFT_3044062 [Cantharellus anzutake]|uniref:uncharacterized protein n=1 Tax=Cantharellus anzutake TaxID=1750568 RepID=UPI001906D81E|nr:uncharacterized protein EI90DRAFT_3044062 [Cantharellus anzutake]KAF8336904.1 hypothetical protein EI90DRAFT_3044062 [Cantharellus anzutake]
MTSSVSSRSTGSCLICRLRRKKCSEPLAGEACVACAEYRLPCLSKQGRSLSAAQETSQGAKKARREINQAIKSRDSRDGPHCRQQGNFWNH